MRLFCDEMLRRLGRCLRAAGYDTAIAETYARNPGFYGETFCAVCGSHFPIGRDGEFVWADAPTERVGT